MVYHDAIAFDSLHKAKFDAGVIGSRPATPEGIGDVYWATDEALLYTTNALGDTWVQVTVDLSVSSLNDLGDVNAPSPTDGQALVWDNGTSRWIPATPLSTLDELTDVDASTPAKGDIIAYDGSTLWDKLNVGTNGQILQANSSATLGIEWVDNVSTFNTDSLLTDGNSVLVDSSGNVITVTV